MFKSSRWRSDKNKIKAIFQLQFQATQVPQQKGKKKMMVSLVPESVGKPTVKLQKVPIVEGTCTWESPIYETMKLIRDSKTGIFKENVYHFIVSSGSSKSGYLGEVSLDFAEFAEATQPLLVSLPLNFTDSGAVLNITIQKIQDNDDKRDMEGNEAPGSLQNQPVDDHDTYEHDELDFLEDDDLQTSPEAERNISFKDHLLENTDWSLGSASDKSMIESNKSSFSRDRLIEAPNDSVEILKKEILKWERQAEVSELELQSLRKQITKESRRGQELSRQIVSLKEENFALKTEYEQLKSSKKRGDDAGLGTKELQDPSEEIKEMLKREKDLNKKLRSRLYKSEDSNSELILVVRDLNKKLEEKSSGTRHLSGTRNDIQITEEDSSETSTYDMDEDTDKPVSKELLNKDRNGNEEDWLKQKITDLNGEIDAYRREKEELEILMEDLVADYDILKQENHNMSIELEQNQKEKVKMQSKYSESLATIEELKVQVDLLEKEIYKQDLEMSKSLDTKNELESHVKILEKELEKQVQDFEDDLGVVAQAKEEQELRAIRAEEALRKTRLDNAVEAERLQDEIKMLSLDMASKFEESERMSKRTVAEASDLRLQKSVLEQMLQKAERDLGLLKDDYEGKVQELLNKVDLQAIQIEQMSQELKAKHIQVESLQKREDEKHKGSSNDIQIFNIEKESLKQRELERELASATKEVEVLLEELSTLKIWKDEKGILVGNLQSELENRNIQYNELKHCMIQIDLEKDSLRKQISKLETELKKKDEAVTSMEKRIKSNGESSANSDISGMTLKGAISALLPYSPKDNVSLSEKRKSLEDDRQATETNLQVSKARGDENSNHSERRSTAAMSRQNEVRMAVNSGIEKEAKASTCDTSDNGWDHTTLLSEVASLKEMNKNMEGELKEMQDKYSEISLKFAEVEGERQQLVMSLRNLKNGKKK